MAASSARALGTLMVALVFGACDRAPGPTSAPLMISKGVVVSHRFQDLHDAPSATLPDRDRSIIATGTLVMRGEPTHLFHAWKSLTLRPTVRVHNASTTGAPVTTLRVDGWDAAGLVAPVQITDEIPCSFLAWRSNATAGCQWLDGEAWFHACQHRTIDPVYTDVHLTLVCNGSISGHELPESERVTQLESRLRRQLLAFKTLVNG